jgi:serine/threonine protein kinase
LLVQFGVRFKVVSSLDLLLELNAGLHGLSQVGKFITAYPSDDTQASAIATELDCAIGHCRGPRIPSDHPLHPTSCIHYRYGAFLPAGHGPAATQSLFDSSGRITPDYRLPFFVHSDDYGPNPFALLADAPSTARKGPFADRYIILQAIHRSVWGRTYDAIDLNADPPCRCIIKEFWHDVAMDPYGRDSSDHAALEATILHSHGGSVLPKLERTFQMEGNIYLQMEHIAGSTLSDILEKEGSAEKHWSEQQLVETGRAIAEAVRQLHEVGVIHRDLKPSNIVLLPSGDVRLIDVAFAYRPDFDLGPPLQFGTRGFMSPNQLSDATPVYADDVFGWGAVMHLLATKQSAESENGHSSTSYAAKAPVRDSRSDLSEDLCLLIERAVSLDTSERFNNFTEALRAIDQLPKLPKSNFEPKLRSVTSTAFSSGESWINFAAATAEALCIRAKQRGDGVAWGSMPEGVRSMKEVFEASIYLGASGIGLFLAAVAQATGRLEFADTARAAARWLSGSEWGHGSTECGLHSGEAGIGLFYIRLASFLNEPGYLNMAVLRARRLCGVVPKTVDLVGGMAGLLIFLAELEASKEDASSQQWAVELGDLLMSKAIRVDGGPESWYWDVPSPIPGEHAESYLGLLHGSAGIGLALLTLGITLHQQRFVEAAIYAAEHLIKKAEHMGETDEPQVVWPRTESEKGSDFSAHCHGSGGIGQFLIRLWCYSKDERHKNLAIGAANAVAKRNPRHSSQCHGLTGDGALFLDVYQATGDPRFLQMAKVVAQELARFRIDQKPGMWMRTERGDSTLDYMTGSAGVGAFFLRLSAAESANDLILPSIGKFSKPSFI